MSYDDRTNRPAMSPGLSALDALSPRLAGHVDVNRLPSTLSPLEALMAQVQQLQNDAARQNHTSRLSPDCLARSLSRGPPTHGQQNRIQGMIPPQRDPASPHPLETTLSRGIEEPRFRPKSQHPVFSDSSRPTSRIDDLLGFTWGAEDQGSRTDELSDNEGYKHRETDEEGLPNTYPPHSAVGSPSMGSVGTSRRGSSDSQNSSVGPLPSHQKQSLNDSYWKSSTLAPPPPIPPMSHLRRSASSGPPIEGSDDEGRSSTAGSTFSQNRQPSISSGVSAGTAIPSPSPVSRSATSSRRNFSRPLSRGSAKTGETPQEALRSNSVTELDGEDNYRQLQRNHKPPPLSVFGRHHSEHGINPHRLKSQLQAAVSPSQLPRGRQPPRNSLIFDPSSGTFSPRQPTTPVNEELEDLSGADVAVPSPDSHSGASNMDGKKDHPSPDVQQVKHQSQIALGPLPSPVYEGVKSRPASSSRIECQFDSPKSPRRQDTTPHVKSRGRPIVSRKISAPCLTQLTAEQHVEKGIECHEAGSLSKSTYHLRLAAMQNDPTGMLLYALACRHGWGMRPNAKEGVRWLRKAVNSVGLDLNSLIDKGKTPATSADRQAQRTREAQFALAIYELGISHMNGWGTEQDRSLALRCFEISANWGDIDALAEAGYCYAEGIGCRRNLKKAARLYRLAESRGMSMVGNSWIHKEKYLDSDEKAQLAATVAKTEAMSSSQDKKARSKSHTRSFFGRKKS